MRRQANSPVKTLGPHGMSLACAVHTLEILMHPCTFEVRHEAACRLRQGRRSGSFAAIVLHVQKKATEVSAQRITAV
jgi:hypothetical protein